MTLTDPYLTLYSSSGIPLLSDDDSGLGLSSLINYTATTSGTYYLGARAFSSGTGSYTLTATGTAPSDDYAATTLTSGRVTSGGSVSGRIESVGDNDWFGISLTAGTRYQFSLDGSTLADPYLSLYSSGGSLIGSDDDSGIGLNALLQFTPTTSGTYYLGADGYSGTGSYTLSATATAAPTPTTGSGSFSIRVVYSGDSQYQSYFDVAAQRWSEVITRDLPDVVNATYGTIDDLLIEAAIRYIDGPGRTLAYAGPTHYRSSSDGGLPYLGIMRFDTFDMASQVSAGTLDDLILHEMGHVLGLGTLWQSRGLASDLDYIGSNAVASYQAVAVNSTLSSVPLESTGGSGTRGRHWSEQYFNAELMTGYAESSGLMPISLITIGALADLGYGVNYNAADYFVV